MKIDNAMASWFRYCAYLGKCAFLNRVTFLLLWILVPVL